MPESFVDVVEVQIKPPHEKRVLATGLTEANAEAYIKFAILRRGVETQFYTTRPAE